MIVMILLAMWVGQFVQFIFVLQELEKIKNMLK